MAPTFAGNYTLSELQEVVDRAERAEANEKRLQDDLDFERQAVCQT